MGKSIYTAAQIDALLSGKGMVFQGQYSTVDEVTDPVEGGNYLIGTEAPFDVYVYVNGVWVNAGPFRGKTGDPGKDGHTPERGVDYWTPADKKYIVDEVLSTLPTYNGEVEDA